MPSKRLIQQAKKALPKTAPKAAQDFLEQFYAKVMAEDLRHITPQDMAEIAMIHMDMIKKRNGQEPVIRIEQKASRKNEGLGFTALHLLNEDMTFLVDSIAARLSHDYKYIDLLIHPIIYGKTNKSGVLQKVETKPSPSLQTLSHMYIELHGMVADNKLDDLKNELLEIIKDVRCATRDWLLMKDKIYVTQAGLKNAPCSKLEKEEYISFLDYVLNDNFTLLGYREYKFSEKKGKVESQVVDGESLGILSDERRAVYKNKQREKLTPDLQSLRKNQDPLTVCKANRRATVHRPVPMDAIAVKQYDKKGNVTGEHVFLGLFTSVTYSRSINDIPLLRRKADQAIALSGFKEGSHNDKGLHHILEKYPRDELFQISVEQLLETSLSILSLQERQRIALYVRPDPFGRYVSCLVYVPRDRFETKLRLKMAEILEESFSGDCGSFYVNVDDSPSARVLFIITVDESDKLEYDVDEIEAKPQTNEQVFQDETFSTETDAARYPLAERNR
jgi:glutamate dehydrogenase